MRWLTRFSRISEGVPLQLPQAPASYAPVYGGSLDLVSNGSDFPRTFSMPTRAYNNGFVTHWGEQLTTFNGTIGNHPGDFGPRPWLAKSWEIKDNGLTYIFNLEEGVRWASTPRVTVDETVDVTANDWVELAKLNFGLEESAYPSRYPEVDGAQSWTALDDYTLQVKLNRNAASFLYKTRGLGPLLVGLQGYKEKMEADGIEMVEAMRDWGMQVGTGPWIIQDFTPDVSIAFEKNPNYWGTDDEGNQLPFIDGIEVFKMADERAQDAGFRTGKIGALGIETCGINTQRYEAINKTIPAPPGKSLSTPATRGRSNPTTATLIRHGRTSGCDGRCSSRSTRKAGSKAYLVAGGSHSQLPCPRATLSGCRRDSTATSTGMASQASATWNTMWRVPGR